MAEQTPTVPRAHIYRILLSDAFERAKGAPCWNEAFRAALAGRGLALVEPGVAFFNPGDVYPDDAPLEAPTCNIGPGSWPARTVVAWASNMLPNGGFDIPPGANPLTQLHNGEMILPRSYAEKILGKVGQRLAPEDAAREYQIDILPPWLRYDQARDELVIHGKRYAAAVFGSAGLAGAEGSLLQLVDGGADKVTVRRWHNDALLAVLDEVERATRKFPTWPDHGLHAMAILGEEFGELTRAMLQMVYEPHKVTADDVAEEAIQTAAMALRLVMSLGRYRYERSEQHSQGEQP